MSSSLFALFGNPVAHSKSPLMHNLAFQGLGEKHCYTRYRLDDGTKLKEKFLSLNLQGANITVPHKRHAFEACDHLDAFAQKIGVVNTIVKREGELYGYNTDAKGFLKAMSAFKEAKEILFLGAGGTAQSSAPLLKEAGYEVTLLNRSPKRLEAYKAQGFATYTFDDFQPKAYDLIINMTSAGLQDDSYPAPKALLDALLPLSAGAIDVIYGKETPFLKLAKSHQLPTQDGATMLLYQGVIAFEHFMEYRYSFDEIKPLMQKAFEL
jgi:shikimate dehydrogenase